MAKTKKSGLKWKTEKRFVKDLFISEINPRKCSPENKKKLNNLLDEFDLVEIPVIDIDNYVIAGNKRVELLMEAGRGDEQIDVRVPNRKLTESELKRYMLVSNVHAGEFDAELLDVHFEDVEIEFAIPLVKPKKVRESDISTFKDTSVMRLTFTNEALIKVKGELNRRQITAESIILNFLFGKG